MANGLYGIFESSLITGRNFSFVSDRDLENGMLVHRGELVSDVQGNEVYQAIVPTAASIGRNEPVYVVGNPAWSYDDSSIVNQNEDKYFIPAGTIFRVYSLNVSDRFGIADYGIEGHAVEIGHYIGLLADSAKPENTFSLPASGFAARVIEMRDMGHEYWVGQKIDQRTRKVRVEVVRNG